MLNQQPFIQEVLIKKHLQDHEESKIQILVVNLPMSNSTTLPKNNPSKKLRHTPRDNKPRTRAKKVSLTMRASYVMIK